MEQGAVNTEYKRISNNMSNLLISVFPQVVTCGSLISCVRGIRVKNVWNRLFVNTRHKGPF